MKPVTITILTLSAAALCGCNKPSAQNETTPEPPAAPATTTASQVAAASAPSTPAPSLPEHTPVTAAAPAPSNPAPELAPPGVFYLLDSVKIETDSGVTGLTPGTGVKLLHDDVYQTPAGEAHLRADQLTNDMTLARKTLQAFRASQNATAQQMAADAARVAAKQRAEALATPTPMDPTSQAAPAQPTSTALSNPNGALNATHSSTKENVHTDAHGTYWLDVFGKKHYF